MMNAPSAVHPEFFVDNYGPQWDVEIVDIGSSMDDSRLHSMDGPMVGSVCLYGLNIQPGLTAVT